ncbi:PC4 and SFRS1-interacting protein [Homalodisca vitripennis]|nr:PC4 and SFRS1-interacting protein [Homalodisca vitripennis]
MRSTTLMNADARVLNLPHLTKALSNNMTAKELFRVGEIIFAKVKGYAHWPAIINSIEESLNNKTVQYIVTFFGTNETGIIKQIDIFKYMENIEKYGKPKTNNYRNVKFNNALLEAERHLNSNSSPCCNSKIEELQEKILNLTAGDDLDHDASLSLAAEVGNALLTENTLLKQQLYDLKTQRSESQLELEDKIKLAEDITGELRGKISMLEKEMEFIKTKLKSECKLREDIIQQSENEKCCLSTQINNVLSTNSDLRNKIKQLEDETTDKSLLINSLDEENCQLKGGKHNLEIELEENKSLVKAIASNYKEILTKISEQESTARKHLKHLENILKAANPQLLSNLPHETTHHLNTQKNKHIYSTSLKVAKNKILQLQCPTLEEELAQENPTPEKIQVNTTERDNSTLTNRADERDTNKCRQTFIKHPPHNSFIRSHGESYEDFLSNHINSYKDLIIMNTSCYNIEHNTSPSLENNEDKNQDNFLVKAKQPKEKHKSYINYKTVTFWNQDYKKILMNKNTNKLGQK